MGTRTYVELPVPGEVWELIYSKLNDAGYDHAMDNDDGLLLMDGIALAVENSTSGGKMKNITITMRDGSKREHKHVGRSGGSYSVSLRYELGFVVVVDEYGNEIAYPSQDVEKVDIQNLGGGW